MQPVSIGRGSRRAWVVLLVWSATALGQGWETESVDPKGHVGGVVAASVSGKLLATAGLDGVVKLWNDSQGTLTHRLDLVGHNGPVLAVALAPSGGMVATGGADRTVRLWGTLRGTLLATLSGHSGPVEALAFRPDGQLLASGGLDADIRVWSVAARQSIRTLVGHEQGIRGLAFSPDGKTLASASRDRSVRTWDAAEGKLLATIGFHDAAAWCVAYSPDGKALASGGLDRTVRFWNIEAKPGTIRIPMRSQVVTRANPVRGDLSDTLSSHPPSPGVLPFGPESEFAQGNQPNQVRGLRAGAAVLALAFPPDGRYLAAALSDPEPGATAPGSVGFIPIQGPIATAGGAELGRIPPRPPIRGHLGPILGLAFADEGRTITTVGSDASIRTWEPANAGALGASIGRTGPGASGGTGMLHLDPVEAVALSPDGRRLATASGGNGVGLWDPATRSSLGRLVDPAGSVHAVAFSPDGKLLALGGEGKAVLLRDPETGRPVASLGGHLDAVTALAFSPDGKTLASGSRDASVTLWDVESKAERATLARHTSAITALAFAPSGTLLATAGLDRALKLWEAPSGRFLASLDAKGDIVDALAFDPVGKTLASADRSGTIRLWDVDGRSERFSARLAREPIRALAFEPGGGSLVIGVDDGSIRRLDPVDGRAVAPRLLAHAGPVLALGFGASGKTLASGGLDRELKLWDVADRLGPRPFAQQESKVTQLSLSKDGKILATASPDLFARVFDVATGRRLLPPIRFESPEVRIALSPDGKLLAVLPVRGEFGSVRLWDVAEGHVKESWGLHGKDASAVAFAPDGKAWAVAEGPDVNFSAVAPSLASSLPFPKGLVADGPVRSLAFSPDGKAIVAGLLDGRVELLTAQANRKDDTIFRSTDNSVEIMAYSPDGNSLALGGTDRVVRVIDAEHGEVRQTLRGHRKAITGLAFTPDGKALASAADGDPTAIVWDLGSGAILSRPTRVDPPADEGVACVAFSPDGKTLYAGGNRGVTPFDEAEWHHAPALAAPVEPKRGRERATLRGLASGVRALTFAGAGSKLIGRDEEGVILAWDLLDGNRERKVFGEGNFPALAMALRPDGKTLAVGLRLPSDRLRADDLVGARRQVKRIAPSPAAPPQKMADEVKFWDVEAGEARGMISGEATGNGTDRVVSLAYSPDGKALVTASMKGVVALWDAETLAPRAKMPGREAPADFVQFSPDSKTVLGADASGRVTLWEAGTGLVRARFIHDGGMNQVAVSPDGRLVATAGGHIRAPGTTLPLPFVADLGPGAGGDVRLWDMATGRRVAVLPMPAGRVARLAFSPDGKALAASTAGPSAAIWDVASAAPVATLAWPSAEAKALAFAPDGKALALGGEDGTLRVWSVPTGALRAELPGHDDAINALAFSPDGKTLATGGRDAAVKLWDVPGL